MRSRSADPSHRYQRNVVSLRRVPRKLVDFFKNAFRHVRAILTLPRANHPFKYFHGAVPAEYLAFLCLRFVESVAVKEQALAGIQGQVMQRPVHVRKDAEHEIGRPHLKPDLAVSASDHWWAVTRIDEGNLTRSRRNEGHDRGKEHLFRVALAKRIVRRLYLLGQVFGRLAMRPQNNTRLRGKECRGDAFAGHVRDHCRYATVVHRESVEEIPPDILGGTPVFTRTRVPVRILMEYLEAGDRLDDFLQDFPSVSRDQAVAVLEKARVILAGEQDEAAA